MATTRNFWTGPCLLVGGKHPAGARVAFGRRSASTLGTGENVNAIVPATSPSVIETWHCNSCGAVSGRSSRSDSQ